MKFLKIEFFDLWDGKEIEQKVKIVVINHRQLNYRGGIDFLNEIIQTGEVINPLTEKKFNQKEITYFVNKNFSLKSSLGNEKFKIVEVDLYYETLRD